MLSNVFICTLIMWALTAIVVTPLADRWVANALAGNELRLAANAGQVLSFNPYWSKLFGLSHLWW